MALFSSSELAIEIERRLTQARQHVAQMSNDELASGEVDELAAAVVARYALSPVELLLEDVEAIGEPKQVYMTISDFGRGTSVPHMQYSVVVPYEGSSEVLTNRPNMFGPVPPQQSTVRGQAILMELVVSLDADERRVEDAYRSELRSIEQVWLPSANSMVLQAKSDMQTVVVRELTARREAVLHARNVSERLPFLRRRNDAPTVPVARRAIKISQMSAGRPAASAGQRESGPQEGFVLPDDLYEDLLRTLTSFGHALERNPTTFERLDEEELRDFLLVILNATYEGVTSGEVFNGASRADLLLRWQDSNVFIAECKIWNGQAHLQDAIDQLLGNTTWRDTKTALIVFIREGDATSIISKAAATVEGHPYFVRCTDNALPERAHYVLRHPSDESRHVRLALLPFVVHGGAVVRTRTPRAK